MDAGFNYMSKKSKRPTSGCIVNKLCLTSADVKLRNSFHLCNIPFLMEALKHTQKPRPRFCPSATFLSVFLCTYCVYYLHLIIHNNLYFS